MINTIRYYMFIIVNIIIREVFVNDNTSKMNWYGKSVFRKIPLWAFGFLN